MTHDRQTRAAILRLAAETDLDVRTVHRAVTGGRVHRATRTLLRDATQRLGLAVVIPQEDATAA